MSRTTVKETPGSNSQVVSRVTEYIRRGEGLFMLVVRGLRATDE